MLLDAAAAENQGKMLARAGLRRWERLPANPCVEFILSTSAAFGEFA